MGRGKGGGGDYANTVLKNKILYKIKLNEASGSTP